MGNQLSNVRVEKYFDKHAAGYDKLMSSCERRILGSRRRWATLDRCRR